jgi:hypothetical protein
LIIPGIIFGVYYMLAEYILIDKNIAGMDAVRLSKKYLEGLWLAAVYSLMGLFAVSIGLTVLSEIITAIIWPKQWRQPPKWNHWLCAFGACIAPHARF